MLQKAGLILKNCFPRKKMTSMFKKLWITCITIIGFANIVRAQEAKSFPAFTLRTNPFSALEHDANIMLGVGVHFSKRIAISVEPGWVFYNLYSFNDDSRAASGLKLRADVRYFLREFVPFGKNRFIPFIAAEFHYKNLLINRTADFGMNCMNGNCEYFQQSDYQLNRKEAGGLLKFGGAFPISRSQRFNGEFFVGLGARTQKFAYKNIPFGGNLSRNLSEEANDFPYLSLSRTNPDAPTILISSGIKLFYFLSPSK